MNINAKMSEMYSNIDRVMSLTFADSSDGEYLKAYLGTRSLQKKASRAVRKGIFIGTDEAPFNAHIGSRFGLNNLTYEVIEKMVMDNIRDKYGSIAILRAVSLTDDGTAIGRTRLVSGHK